MSGAHESQSRWVINTTQDSFERDVIEQSRQRPVVVDFWAEWCAPCRMLTPILEQLAQEYNGEFVLVKADTDKLPDAAARFNVQGIPAVYGLVDGEIVDFFSGALPAEQIQSWLGRLFSQGDLAQAKRLEGSDPAAAEASYQRILEQHPNESTAQIGLARAQLAQEKREECRATIEHLEQRGFLEPEAEKIRAALELGKMKGEDLEQRRVEAEAHPEDLELQLKLAEALAGEQRYEQALETCLQIVQKDKKGVGEEARQRMVEIFHVLPDDSELVRDYRRKLSLALY